MNFELICIKGRLSGRRWTIPATGLKVGGAEACEVRVSDPSVAPYHCVLEVAGDQASVNNLASDSGIDVNGVSVRNRALAPSDVIRIGGEAFIVAPVRTGNSGGLAKLLPWLLVGALGAAVAWLLVAPKEKTSEAAPMVSVGGATNVTARIDVTTIVSNRVNVVTVTNEQGVVVVRTNTVTKVVGAPGGKPAPEAKKCPCPPGTKHIGKCPCGGLAGCSCLVVEPCKCAVGDGNGLMHRAPEKCPCGGAPNCACVTVAPAATPDDFTLLFGAGACKAARRFERTVLANMGDMGKALARGETTRTVVADAAFKMADKPTQDPFLRYLYLKGAFALYARDIRPGEAMRTWQHVRFLLPDLDPRAAVETLELATKDLPTYKDPLLDRALEAARARVPFAAALEKLQAKPGAELTAADRLLVADNAAALGDWPLALKSLAAAGEKWKGFVALESNPAAKPHQRLSCGDIWWQRGEERPVPVRAAYRARAAEDYVAALSRTKGEDALPEEERPRLEARIATARKEMEAAPYAGDADYILVDLSAGPNAAYYPVRPLAVDRFMNRKTGEMNWKEAYKTRGLVLRRVRPGAFDSHGLKFHVTRPYYLGVFEVTQRQYELVTGTNPSRFKGDGLKPVEQVSYDRIRGDKLGRTWPRADAVDEDSFLGRLRRRTGLAFDLPTEIQWEYACRAGTTGEFDGETDPKAMEKLGRYNGNGGRKPDPNGAKDANGNVKLVDVGPAPVGSYRANPWGFYDMHGNVWEWCLDRAQNGGWEADGYGGGEGVKEGLVDPTGWAVGVTRFHRGGSWVNAAADCRASRRNRSVSRGSWHSGGFRLACPQGLPFLQK